MENSRIEWHESVVTEVQVCKEMKGKEMSGGFNSRGNLREALT